MYDELRQCKNHLFHLAELYSKFSEIQKRLQGKNVTIIQARTIILGFQAKIEVFKSSLARSDFKYFSNLRILTESEHMSDYDLEAYIIHPDRLREVFYIRFGDLENMYVPEWLVTQIDTK